MIHRSRLLFPLAALALLAGGARSGSAAGALATVRVAQGLALPVFVTSPPADSARLFILEQHTGNIRVVRNGVMLARPFLTQGGLSTDTEEGLLGLAFHPSYKTNGLFYIYYTQANGNPVIRRYHVSANPDSADPASGSLVLSFYHPQTNHNGGWIAFGPDGYLYVGIGDGGNGGDTGTGHAPGGNAQSDTTRLGKILRLDVNAGPPYGIPPTNPFAGAASPQNEFWAKGVRNPWRDAFDRQTGDLYIADVGQDTWEEVDFQPAGAAGGRNYGWRKLEGFAVYNCANPCDSSGITLPVYVYGHNATIPKCAITGGYVMRDPMIPALSGSYFFGDYCSAQVWSFQVVGGVATGLTEQTSDLSPSVEGDPIESITSFGEDARGRMYLITQGSGSDGALYRIQPRNIAAVQPGVPAGSLRLFAPRPNPAPGRTTIGFHAGRAGRYTLAIFNAAGERVRTLVRNLPASGESAFEWDGADAGGGRAPAGTYLLRLSDGSELRTGKLALLR